LPQVSRSRSRRHFVEHTFEHGQRDLRPEHVAAQRLEHGIIDTVEGKTK
jgi:hypothetical protein